MSISKEEAYRTECCITFIYIIEFPNLLHTYMVDLKNKYKINILIIVLLIHILANKNFVKNLAIYIFENLFPIRAPKSFHSF